MSHLDARGKAEDKHVAHHRRDTVADASGVCLSGRHVSLRGGNRKAVDMRGE